MDHRQPLTIDDVQRATRPLLGGAASVRLLEAKHRNQVFAVGEAAIFKAYLRDGSARQARKIAALGFLEGRGLPVPRLLGHGVLPKGPSGVPWTLESRVVAGYVRPTRAELDTPQGSFVAGYLEQGRLDPDAPERFAFYQLEHCLDVLGWARDADPAWLVQAQRLIEQVLDGVRLRLA